MLWLCTLVLTVAPLDVASQKQLFIDHRFIAESNRVETAHETRRKRSHDS